MHPSSSYAVFWNCLKESKLNNGLLDFGMINPIEGTFRTIIARKCYFNLWNILNGPDAKQNNLITGSPGIGKSMFLLFVMWKLKLDGKSFVYIHHKPKIFY